MSTIDRYRKPGGFVQLVMLIESATKDKQEKFLNLIAAESGNWELEVRKKILTMDRVLTWNPEVLTVIFSKIPASSLAAAIYNFPKETQAIVKSCLSHIDQKRVDDFMENNKPTGGEVFSCHVRIYGEIRALVAEGTLKFEKFDEAMFIAKGIEQKLDTASLSFDFENMKNQVVTMPPQAVVSETATADQLETQKRINLLLHENNRLNQENQALKNELLVLRDKLERIKKIA